MQHQSSAKIEYYFDVCKQMNKFACQPCIATTKQGAYCQVPDKTKEGGQGTNDLLFIPHLKHQSLSQNVFSILRKIRLERCAQFSVGDGNLHLDSVHGNT